MTLMMSQPRIDVESPVVPTVVFDPPIVKPGQKAIYRVTFNALEESVEWPAKVPVPPGVEFQPGGHGQMLSMAGATLLPRTTFNFRLWPKTTGEVTIPAFTVSVYGQPVTVPAARLEVTPVPPPSLGPAQCLVLEVPQTNVFVGEAVPVSIVFPGLVGFAMQGQAPVQLNGQGFITDLSTFRPRFETRAQASGRAGAQVFLYDGMLTPIAAGKLSLSAQSFVAVRPASLSIGGPAINPNLPNYTLLDSDPLELQVRPLPRSGRLAGFTGAVGIFAVTTPQLSTNVVRVGEPVRLSVKIRGEGNLLRLVPPPPPRPRDWQILAGSTDTLPPQIIQAQGFTTFSFALIPLSEKARFTPAIPFSCFDPEQAVYRDLTIPSVPVTVKPGYGPVDLQAIARANAIAVEPEKEPTLGDLAASPGLAAASLSPVQRRIWFSLFQLAPASVFAGLWFWDKRRRYFEQHPDELLRRRARRALRREWRALHHAARAGDAPRFASAVVSALRVACAPHLPAEPRALVGSDVLALLPEADRAGHSGTVVRRFFAVFDAERFATASGGTDELLALQPDLERVLEQLEERL